MSEYKSFRRWVIELLNDHPELADQPHEIAERVGCSIKSVANYIQAWEETKDIVWVLDPVARTTACDRCRRINACRVLDSLELPVLCERVPDMEMLLAANRGLLDVIMQGRDLVDGAPITLQVVSALVQHLEDMAHAFGIDIDKWPMINEARALRSRDRQTIEILLGHVDDIADASGIDVDQWVMIPEARTLVAGGTAVEA